MKSIGDSTSSDCAADNVKANHIIDSHFPIITKSFTVNNTTIIGTNVQHCQQQQYKNVGESNSWYNIIAVKKQHAQIKNIKTTTITTYRATFMNDEPATDQSDDSTEMKVNYNQVIGIEQRIVQQVTITWKQTHIQITNVHLDGKNNLEHHIRYIHWHLLSVSA